LNSNPAICAELKKCDADVDWPQEIVEIYSTLSNSTLEPSVELVFGEYLVYIAKGLPKHYVYFVKVIGKELYGDFLNVRQSIGRNTTLLNVH
jgi:hypothetical protein